MITVPEKPYSDPGNYNRQAQRLAQENGWFWANQFDNVANRQAHFKTTGPEIWEETGGEVTGFVASVGTGGTLTTARAILAARVGKSLSDSDTILPIGQLRELLSYIGRANLEDRKRLPTMPAARADVLPAALATVIAFAEIGALHQFQHSLYNLRWGLAAEALN